MPLTFTQVKAFPPEVYTGAGLPAKTHVSEHAERIRGRCFGNRKKVKPLHLLLPSLADECPEWDWSQES